MGGYNIGDKFVIEIKGIEDGGFYRISESGQDITSEETLNRLDVLNYEYVNEHFREMQDEAFAAGQNDAWETVRNILGMGKDALTPDEVEKIFSSAFLDYVCLNYSAGEAKRMIEKYRQNRWLEAGEIITTTKGRAVVMSADGGHYSVILLEAETADAEEKTVKDSSFILGRTGRKIDICNLLREAAGIQNKK